MHKKWFVQCQHADFIMESILKLIGKYSEINENIMTHNPWNKSANTKPFEPEKLERAMNQGNIHHILSNDKRNFFGWN